MSEATEEVGVPGGGGQWVRWQWGGSWRSILGSKHAL